MDQISYTDASGTLRTIDLLSLELRHISKATPTDSPVEDGADITDHVRPELRECTFKAHVSNHNVAETTNVNGATAAPASADLPSGAKATVVKWSGAFDRPKSVYDELETLRLARLTCSIITQLVTYDVMVITSITAPVKAVDAIEFEIQARELRIVQTQTAAAQRTSQVRGQSRANVGQLTASGGSFATVAALSTPPSRSQSTSTLGGLLGL
jgi:hypothetical protein